MQNIDRVYILSIDLLVFVKRTIDFLPLGIKSSFVNCKENNFAKMIKLQIIPMISSGENGSIDQRAKSFHCVKLYTNSKFNRSVKRFSSKVSRSQSTCTKHDFEKRSEVFKFAGTSLNLNKGNSGRRRFIRTAEILKLSEIYSSKILM